jgi:hypothetical protein
MTIVDTAGIRMSDLRANVVQFIKLSSDVIDAHYPGRVRRLVIINAPSWFASAWAVIARVLPQSTRYVEILQQAYCLHSRSMHADMTYPNVRIRVFVERCISCTF